MVFHKLRWAEDKWSPMRVVCSETVTARMKYLPANRVFWLFSDYLLFNDLREVRDNVGRTYWAFCHPPPLYCLCVGHMIARTMCLSFISRQLWIKTSKQSSGIRQFWGSVSLRVEEKRDKKLRFCIKFLKRSYQLQANKAMKNGSGSDIWQPAI